MEKLCLESKDLLQALACGDRNRFRDFVEEYKSMVFTLCMRIIGNRPDAEEASQDVFVKVFQQASQFRGDSKVTTWFYRIAVNTSLNYLRKRKWNLFFSLGYSSDDEKGNGYELIAPESERPDRVLAQKYNRKILNDAILALPVKQKTAFILHKCNGLSYQEIAQVMELSLSAVESLIHRAKLQMQKRLAKIMQETREKSPEHSKFLYRKESKLPVMR